MIEIRTREASESLKPYLKVSRSLQQVRRLICSRKMALAFLETSSYTTWLPAASDDKIGEFSQRSHNDLVVANQPFELPSNSFP